MTASTGHDGQTTFEDGSSTPGPTVECGSSMGGDLTAAESTTQDETFVEKPSIDGALLNDDAPKIVDVARVQVTENTEESSTDGFQT